MAESMKRYLKKSWVSVTFCKRFPSSLKASCKSSDRVAPNTKFWFRLLGLSCPQLYSRSEFNIDVSFGDILKILGVLPFSGVTLTVPFAKSMSVHLRLHASPALIPVSLSKSECLYVCFLTVFLVVFGRNTNGKGWGNRKEDWWVKGIFLKMFS